MQQHQFCEYFRKVYWGTASIWSEGYFASTVGRDEEIIKNYIENQGKEDEGRAPLEKNNTGSVSCRKVT